MSLRFPVKKLTFIGTVSVKKAEEDENLDSGSTPDGIIADNLAAE